MAGKYQIISADSHLEASPDSWTHWVPAKWRDQAPHLVRLENGRDAIVMGGRPPALLSAQGVRHLIPNVPRDQLHLQIPTFDNAAGAGGPEQRLSEQDQDGVDAEVLFTRVQNLRQLKDAEGSLALLHAFNQYLAEEYMAVAPDRLIPLGVLPTSGVDHAINEMEYCAEAGMKGVILDRFPSGRGYPTPEDDRFWAASLDLRMPLTSHTSGGTTRMTRSGEPTFNYTKGVEMDADGTPTSDPMRDWMFRFCGDAACAPVQMAFAGVFDRFPALQLYWGETMAGWIKYALFQIDDHYDRFKHMAAYQYGLEPPKRPLSEYLRDHNLWGFLLDPIGVEDRDAVGSDKLLWGSDFAHLASDWPDSSRTIELNFAGVPEDERYMMLAGNAIRFFHLDD